MSLEQRVQRLEDLAAITALISAYGPAVDAGAAASVAGLFAGDGVYDVAPLRLKGTAALTAMVEGPDHQALLDQGCAHLQGVPDIVLVGDEATAVNYTVVFLHEPGGFAVWRVAANR